MIIASVLVNVHAAQPQVSFTPQQSKLVPEYARILNGNARTHFMQLVDGVTSPASSTRGGQLVSARKAKEQKALVKFQAAQSLFNSKTAAIRKACPKLSPVDTTNLNRFDSIVTRDANGRPTLKKIYKWDKWGNIPYWEVDTFDTQQSKWTNKFKEEIVFCGKDQATLSCFYDWDKVNNAWLCTQKVIQKFNSFGQTLLSELYVYDEDAAALIGSTKSVTAYNALDSCILTEDYYWDTTTNGWAGSSKYTYTYDSSMKRLLQDGSYDWDSEKNEFYLSTKTDYSYDAAGNDTLDVQTYYDTDTQEWGNYMRFEKSYDKNNNLIKDHSLYWDTDSVAWINNTIFEYAYTDNNLPTKRYYASWDYDNYVWKMMIYQSFIYDDKDRVSKMESHKWDSDNNIYVAFKDHVTYDTSDNPVIDDFDMQLYSDTAAVDKWVPAELDVRKYDANNNNISHDVYVWNDTTEVWDNYSKLNATYNAANKLTFIEVYNWDSNTQAWVGDYKQCAEYNDEGLQLRGETYSWDTDKNGWVGVNGSVFEYIYNDAVGKYLESSLTLLTWDYGNDCWINNEQYLINYDTNSNLLLMTKNVWNNETSSWNLERTETYYYSQNHQDGVTPATVCNSVTVKVENGKINVLNSDAPVFIYDLQGRTYSHDATFPQGIYIVKVGLYTQKVIVR